MNTTTKDPGIRVPDFVPTIEVEGGFVFVTCKENHRLSIATTVERLINMLDDMEDDPDLEPYLAGWETRNRDDREGDYPHQWGGTADDEESADSWIDDDLEPDEDLEDVGDDEPLLGAPERHPEKFRGRETRADRRAHSQEDWAAGGEVDEREDVAEDEGAQCEGEGEQDDREHSLGWQDEGSQALLSSSMGWEADLGSTEETDQVRRLERAPVWVDDGEPDLGWTGHGRGCTDDEPRDDREGDDEREPNGDEQDTTFSVDEVNAHHRCSVAAGEPVRQINDGFARFLVPVITRVDGFVWDRNGFGNLPPEAFEGGGRR